MVTHQIGFPRFLADEIIFMEKGRIAEQGFPKAFLAGSGRTCRDPGVGSKTGRLFVRRAALVRFTTRDNG